MTYHSHRPPPPAARRDECAELEAHLRLVLAQVPAVAWATDGEYRLTSARGMGYTPEETIGRLAWEVVEGSRTEIIAAHTRALGGEDVAFDAFVNGRNFRARVEPLRLAGATVGVIGVALEVTEQVRAERALEQHDERFRKLVEQSLAGIYILDGETFEYVNPRFARVFGYEPFEMQAGFPVERIVAPGDLEKVRTMIRLRMEGGARSLHYGFRGLRSDGSMVHVEVHGGPVGEGADRRILGVLLDVSSEVEAERRLHAQERRFRSLTENLQDVIAVVDRSAMPQYVSPSVEQVLGYSTTEMLVEPLLARVHVDDRPRVEQALAEPCPQTGSAAVLTFRMQHRDGGFRLLEASSRDLTDDPAIAGIVVAARDVTERSALQEQLRQAQKMEAVGLLAGGVAHDFNNILTAIHGYVELLLEEVEAESALREYGEEIRHASERAAALTSQLLAFSRKQVLQPRVFDVGELIVRLQRMLERLIREDIALEIVPPGRRYAVRADPAQIEQVVLNLVVNARDAVAPGGHIRVTLAESDLIDDAAARPGVVLAVMDDGCGIEPATLPRVFDPFFTTKPPGQGTGLGLSTVYGIVAQSNGQVTIDSTVGAGTTVRVWLPLVAAEVVAGIPALAAPPGGSERLLLVEDDEALRLLGQRALERAGFEVVTAANGALALERVHAERGRFDLLITDVVMPVLNGRQLVERLQADGYRMPVLYVSGYTEDEIVRRGVAAAEEHLLSKPFTGSMLVQTVRRLLDARARGR